jgi:hypothetical protein
MTSPKLINKETAAQLLGVSRTTFDRLRNRTGLKPAQTVKLRPVLFHRHEVIDLIHNAFPPQNGDGLLSLREIKARAKGGKL